MDYQGDVWLDINGDTMDISVVNGQPVMTGGLENAVSLSLYVDGSTWINALGSSEAGAYTGSISKFQRRTLTNKARLDAEQFVVDALAWMKTEGMVTEVQVTSSIPSPGMLLISIILEQPSGSTEVKYQINWATMEAQLI